MIVTSVFSFSILVNIVVVLGDASNNSSSETNARVIRSSNVIRPIKPMSSANQRSFRAPPINPDSELIISPSRSHRYQYEKIMERLQSLPTTTNRPKKKGFNFLNFDAYLVKPLNVNYKKVFATVQPEAEKLLSIMSKSDDMELVDVVDDKNSTSSYSKG